MALDENENLDGFFAALDEALNPPVPDTRAEAQKVLSIAAFATTFVATNDEAATGFVSWLKDLGVSERLTADESELRADLASAAITLTLTS
jgi:hypothetical protein